MWRLSFSLLIACVLVGCSSSPTWRPQPDGPPVSPPQGLENLPDPTPRQEPKSKRGNPTSYVVLGRTYYVMESADGYAETGNASWYGRKFHGRLTSSGEPFDMYQLTAAHRSLPIPTYARVTNLANGRSTIVRINDRGPFHDDRIIDLSYAAAVKLDFHNRGTTRVRVEVLSDSKLYMVQAGAFSTLASADRMLAQLKLLTQIPAFVVRTGQDQLYRVRLGPIESERSAKALQDLMLANQLGRPIIMPQ